MNKGWISIHRKIKDHWIWNKSRVFSDLEAWIDLLLHATHDMQKVKIKNTLFEVGRGEQIRSLKTLAKEWNWKPSKVRRFLKLLESDDMIVLKNETLTTRITICNYETYQVERNADETQMKRKRNADETQVDTDNNVNNANNVNNGIVSSAKIKNFDVAKFSEDDIQYQFAKFLNDKIIEYKPNHLNVNKKPNFNKWSIEVDRMLRIDKRDIKTAGKIIRWVFDKSIPSGDFNWRDVIQSPKSLRKNYDLLESKLNQQSNGNRKSAEQFTEVNLESIQDSLNELQRANEEIQDY